MLWIYEHGDKWTLVTEKSPYKDYLWRVDEDDVDGDNGIWLKRLKFDWLNQLTSTAFGGIDDDNSLYFYSQGNNHEFYGVFDSNLGGSGTLILVKDFPSFLSLMEKFSVIFPAVTKSTYSEAEFQLDVERDKELEIRHRKSKKIRRNEQIYKAQKLYREGVPVEEIAKKVDLNVSAIKFQCRNLIARKA